MDSRLLQIQTPNLQDMIVLLCLLTELIYIIKMLLAKLISLYKFLVILASQCCVLLYEVL